MPTVLQLVVDDTLLAFSNLHNRADFSRFLDSAVRLGTTLGQMQEAARYDDAPRVLELLPWFVADLDCLSGDLLAEWREAADTVKRAALGAPIELLPRWVADKQKRAREHGWEPIGSRRPYDRVSASTPTPAPNKPRLMLVTNNE